MSGLRSATPSPTPEGDPAVYAFGLCLDQRYLVPGLAAITALADSLTPRARREAALRVLTLDLAPSEAVLLAHLARRVGFRSFDLARRSPLRTARMADASYISVATYLRFEFTAEFVGRPYVIYIDADTLVRGDLSAPLDALRPGEVGVVRDEFSRSVGDSHALPGVVERWPQLKGRPYYNAGLLWAHVVDLPEVRRGVGHALARHCRHIHHNDQDALNLWFLHTGRARPVASGYNRFELGRFLERGNWARRVVARSPLPDAAAPLIHFVGPEKPWQPTCPRTEEVREYRTHLRRTMRHARALGSAHAEQTELR